jgi:hypothetical protein
MDIYSSNTITQDLLKEIAQAIKTVSPYGSVEIYVQNSTITQITTRNIKKTGPIFNSTNINNNKRKI